MQLYLAHIGLQVDFILTEFQAHFVGLPLCTVNNESKRFIEFVFSLSSLNFIEQVNND